MKDGSYVVIQAFMVNDLKLKGNELIVYATIYGFTQDGEHWFYGTKGYLAEWCGATKGTVGNCLRSLTEKGLLERRDKIEQGQVRIEYRATKNCTPPYKNCDTPRTNFAPINKIDEQPREQPKDIWRGPRKPTIEEVKAYVQEKGYHFDAQEFFDYYDAGGWTMSNGKRVTSWKRCCVTWETTWKKQHPTVTDTSTFSEYDLTKKQPKARQAKIGGIDDIDF